MSLTVRKSRLKRAQEWSTCLVYARPWVPSPVPWTNKQKGIKKEKENRKKWTIMLFLSFFNLTQPFRNTWVYKRRKPQRPGSPGACSKQLATERQFPVQRSRFVQKVTLPGTILRGSQFIVFDSLKHKSPKSRNPASEGRDVNIGKYILEKYRIFPRWAAAMHSSLRSCLLNIHSNFRERNIHICKTSIYHAFSPMPAQWKTSEQFCELLLGSPSFQCSYTFKVGCRIPFSMRWVFRVL